MRVEQSTTIWEKLGAAEGLWAAALLGVQAFLVAGTSVDLAGTDADFTRTLLDERTRWEAITFLRIVAGLMIVWWMGSLAGRLRLAEGEPGRLASIALAVGTLWGGLWLVSALFNSAAILFAADYANPAASRMAATVALESVYVLTPGLLVALTLATGFAVLRHGGFERWFGLATLGVSALVLVLAVIDWYGTGALSVAMLWVSILWMALTSALLTRAYLSPDPVLGSRGGVPSR